MSLNSLAASRVAHDVSTVLERSQLSTASDETAGSKGQDVQNALSSLIEYLPAETITLYLATISAFPVLERTFPGLSVQTVYSFFAILTPVLLLLIYFGKRRAAKQSRSPGLKLWPWWPMIAATIAFLVWALTIPGGPYMQDADGRVTSGLLAIVASALLGVLGRLFAPSSG